MRRRLLAAALLGFATPASAGPPFFTDDPEPTDGGRWEIYGFGTGTLFRHGVEGESGLDLNYGGARDLQLSGVLSLAYARESGGPFVVGVADTELGAKYRFLHQRQGTLLPDVALFPKIELPTAGSRFGTGRVGFSLPVWLQKDWGKWSVFGGGGWTYNPGVGQRNFSSAGLAVTRQVTRRLTLGGEAYRQDADATGGRSSLGLGAGALWQVARRWSLIGSAGPQLEHRAAAGRAAFYVALAFHN